MEPLDCKNDAVSRYRWNRGLYCLVRLLLRPSGTETSSFTPPPASSSTANVSPRWRVRNSERPAMWFSRDRQHPAEVRGCAELIQKKCARLGPAMRRTRQVPIFGRRSVRRSALGRASASITANAAFPRGAPASIAWESETNSQRHARSAGAGGPVPGRLGEPVRIR